jgi:uncharacterized protein YifN (PemK superfamily)
VPINFHPKRGTVLMCDFTSGFQPSEMVKRRHVVVVSPRYQRHTGLCLVVPFSTGAPYEIELHHYEIRPGSYDFLDPTRSVWAKFDMLFSSACRKHYSLTVMRLGLSMVLYPINRA